LFRTESYSSTIAAVAGSGVVEKKEVAGSGVVKKKK
jgi:hypothetical protein